MQKLYGVIGDPIAHSMSPAMHNDLFQFYGIEGKYLSFRVGRENLQEAVKGFKAIGAGGFNVTIPHKSEIIPYLDKMDPLAEAIGAVNTVKNENGLLVGYNTDGPGFVKGLSSRMADLLSRSALIIGAGGAAKAIYYSLAQAGVRRIDIYNRTEKNAVDIVNACPFTAETEVVNQESAERHLGSYGLIIQTTSIGMLPEVDRVPLSIKNIAAGAFVSDIIYNPLLTKFLQEASLKGADVQNGVDMFVFQGALAFEKWTGIFPDTERMKENVLRQLGGFTC